MFSKQLYSVETSVFFVQGFRRLANRLWCSRRMSGTFVFDFDPATESGICDHRQQTAIVGVALVSVQIKIMRLRADANDQRCQTIVRSVFWTAEACCRFPVHSLLWTTSSSSDTFDEMPGSGLPGRKLQQAAAVHGAFSCYPGFGNEKSRTTRSFAERFRIRLAANPLVVLSCVRNFGVPFEACGGNWSEQRPASNSPLTGQGQDSWLL